MPSILHLLDACSAQACPTTLALIGASLDERCGVLLLGGAALGRDAERLGLKPVDRLGVPFGRATLGLPAVCRRLSAYRRVELFHCWSIGALAATTMAKPKVPKVLSLTQPPGTSELGRLGRIIGHQTRRVRIITISDALRTQLLAAGLSKAVVHTVRPGLEPTNVAVAERAAVRERLGLDETTRLVALIGDPPQAGDARLAALAAGLAGETRRTGAAMARSATDPRVLVTPTQHRCAQARAMVRALDIEHVLIQDPGIRQPWRVVAGCDAAVAIGTAAEGLALRWTMRLGVPVAAENRPAIAAELTHGRHALLSPPGEAKSLAFSMDRLLHDPALARRLANEAQQAARRRFDPVAYRQALTCHYYALRQPVCR